MSIEPLYHQNKEAVFLVIGSLPWLGIRGVYVNSSIVDEGASSKNKSFTRLMADSFRLGSTMLIQGLVISGAKLP